MLGEEGGCLFYAFPDRKIIIFPWGTDCEKGFLSGWGAGREFQAVFGLEALTLQGHITMSECVMMCRKDNARSTCDGTRPACHHVLPAL